MVLVVLEIGLPKALIYKELKLLLLNLMKEYIEAI